MATIWTFIRANCPAFGSFPEGVVSGAITLATQWLNSKPGAAFDIVSAP